MLHVLKTHHRWPRSKIEKQPLNPNKEPTTQTPISHEAEFWCQFFVNVVNYSGFFYAVEIEKWKAQYSQKEPEDLCGSWS